eukprot:4619293-Pyramimonas_sp.AAC.1
MPMGPMPGPPPPCGMQKVLCRFKWHTSAPISPGEVSPTCAFMFAPSMYTWRVAPVGRVREGSESSGRAVEEETFLFIFNGSEMNLRMADARE